jgi:hypothetical protein
MQTEDAKRLAWCAMAEAYLRDAQRIENSLPTRADLAFEACYLWSLSLAREVLEPLNHPDPAIFGFAADKLGWRNAEFAPAQMHLVTRLIPECHGVLLDALIPLAERLQAAVASVDFATASHSTNREESSHAPANRQ